MMFIWCAIIPKYQAQEPIQCCCNSILLALVSSTCQLWGFYELWRPELIQKQQGSAARRKGRFRQCRRGDICDIYGLQGGKQWDQCRQKQLQQPWSLSGAAELNATLFCLSRHPWNSCTAEDVIFQMRNSLACKRGRLGCCNWPAYWSFSQRPLSKCNNLIFSQVQCT